MQNKICSSKQEVEEFLVQLKQIINDKKFNVIQDLDILLKKSKEDINDPYTTQNTLSALNYDKMDVKKELSNITISEYLETFIDNKNNNLPKFFAFIKKISNRNVYIKVKIRNKENRKIFCVSFHFARFPITKFPYDI